MSEMNFARKWPQQVIDALGGREPHIGDWYAICCSQDLRRLESQEDIDAAWETLDDVDLGQFFPTKEAALARLL
jgi:hypothetical protein